MQPVATKEFSSTAESENSYSGGTVSPERVKTLMLELKEYIQRNGLKQADVARALGIKRQQLNDWFTGHREPNAERTLQIIELMRKKPRK